MKKNLLLLIAFIFSALPFAFAQSWSITGNAGTSPATNYLGTSDANALQFRVNNQKSAYIDFALNNAANASFGYQTLLHISASRGGNSAFGYQSLYTNTSGAFNTAAGQLSLYLNQTGSSNTASGVRALYSNTTGSFNSAFGNRAAYSNTKGSANTAIGNNALYSNATGYSNVAIGASALYNATKSSNAVAIGDSALFSLNNSYTVYYNTAVGSKSLFATTTGSYNTGMGYQTLYTNTTGASNTAIGFNSLYANTFGNANTAIGDQALYSNKDGYENTAIGQYALHYNTSGGRNTSIGASSLQNNQSGLYNISVGWASMYGNKTGNYNIGIGYGSLYSSDAHDNTAVGVDALSDNTTGIYNTAYGSLALFDNYTGNYNTGVGYDTRVNVFGSVPVNNATVLGNGATATADNQVRIGNSSVTSIGGYVNWSNISDGRFKKNIRTDVSGLSFINKLQPITYTLDLAGINAAIHPAKTVNYGDKKMDVKTSTEEERAMTVKSQIRYNGFIAQDVEKAAKELNYDFSGVDAPKNAKDLYGLRYSDFVVPLVKAVQELSKLNDAKDAKITDLETRLSKLEAMMNGQSSLVTNAALPAVNATSARLDQNVPNPFSGSTTLSYTLPDNASSAKIIITDNNGKKWQEVNVAGHKTGSVTVNASALSSGTYQYSLYVNEKLAGAKQMMVVK